MESYNCMKISARNRRMIIDDQYLVEFTMQYYASLFERFCMEMLRKGTIEISGKDIERIIISLYSKPRDTKGLKNFFLFIKLYLE